MPKTYYEAKNNNGNRKLRSYFISNPTRLKKKAGLGPLRTPFRYPKDINSLYHFQTSTIPCLQF